MSRFVPVAQVAELAPGQMKMIVADQERLLLVNMAGTFYVISDACGHDWAPLSRGKLEGHVVICPRHFARYDVRTGQLLSGPMADDVPIYEVRIEGWCPSTAVMNYIFGNRCSMVRSWSRNSTGTRYASNSPVVQT